MLKVPITALIRLIECRLKLLFLKQKRISTEISTIGRNRASNWARTPTELAWDEPIFKIGFNANSGARTTVKELPIPELFSPGWPDVSTSTTGILIWVGKNVQPLIRTETKFSGVRNLLQLELKNSIIFNENYYGLNNYRNFQINHSL